MDKKEMPSVKSLVIDAWSAFRASFGNVFLLYLLGSVIGFVLIMAVFMGVIGVGFLSAFSGASQADMVKNLEGFLTSDRIGQIGIGFGLLMLVCWIVTSVVRLATIAAVGRYEEKPKLGQLLKIGFKFLIPAAIVGFVAQMLVLGGTVLLVVPGIIIWLFLQFTVYEMVLGGKKWFTALSGSVRVMGQHFGEVLIRMFALWLGVLVLFYLPMYLLELLVSSLMNNAPAQASMVIMILAMIRFILGILLALYSVAYGVMTYRHAKEVTDEEKKPSMVWMWIVALLGLFIASLFLIKGVQVANRSWGEISDNVGLDDGSWTNKIVTKSEQEKISDWKLEMSPEVKSLYDESQDIFKQMAESNKPAEVKKLNDENIDILKKAIKLEGNNPELWASLSDAYTWINSRGTINDALNASKKAEELDSTIWGYANRTANILLTMGKNDEAILKFQEVIRAEDGYGKAHLYLGVAYKRVGVKDQAKVELQKAIDILTEYNSDGSFDQDILYARKEMSGL